MPFVESRTWCQHLVVTAIKSCRGRVSAGPHRQCPAGWPNQPVISLADAPLMEDQVLTETVFIAMSLGTARGVVRLSRPQSPRSRSTASEPELAGCALLRLQRLQFARLHQNVADGECVHPDKGSYVADRCSRAVCAYDCV